MTDHIHFDYLRAHEALLRRHADRISETGNRFIENMQSDTTPCLVDFALQLGVAPEQVDTKLASATYTVAARRALKESVDGMRTQMQMLERYGHGRDNLPNFDPARN